MLDSWSISVLLEDFDDSVRLRVNPMKNQTRQPGESLKIVCPVRSSPDIAFVTWHKNGRLLNIDGDRISLHKHCTNWLYINNAIPHDSGVYRCTASSGSMAVPMETTIKVNGM